MREGQWNAQLPLIVVGPQAGGVQPWWPGAEVKKVLEHVKSSYRVDVRRGDDSPVATFTGTVYITTREHG